MKTTLTRESASKVRLEIEATPDEVRPSLDRAVKSLADQVKIPGFRKGKVPRQVLETRLGKDVIREETLREALPTLVAQAVEQEELSPIAAPSVEVKSYEYGGGLSFEAVVEVRPEVALPDLEGIPVTKPPVEATQEEIDEQLERLRDRFASLETVERPARRGDYVLIDLRTTWNDQEVEPLSGTDQLYEVGSGYIVAKLDDELENARAGDILKFNDTLPEGAGDEWAGREVTFQALVKEVRHKVLPALDDELAKTATELETLDELRADLAERIARVKEAQAEADVRARVLEYIVDVVDVEAPETLTQQEMAYRLQRLEETIRANSLTFEQYLQVADTSEEQIEQELRSQSERSVRAQLILEEVARREGLQVTEEDLREEVRRHAESLRIDPNQLAQQLTEGNRLLSLAGDIIRRKALNHLVERADIKVDDAQAAAGEQTTPSSGVDQGA